MCDVSNLVIEKETSGTNDKKSIQTLADLVDYNTSVQSKTIQNHLTITKIVSPLR